MQLDNDNDDDELELEDDYGMYSTRYYLLIFLMSYYTDRNAVYMYVYRGGSLRFRRWIWGK
jgi:hypothetical protein